MNTFLSIIQGQVAGAKDKAVFELGKFMFTKWGLDKYGEIQSLNLLRVEKRINAMVLLKGELHPIEMGIDYRIDSIGGQSYFIADQITFSREWANLAFQDFCPPEARRMELNSILAAML